MGARAVSVRVRPAVVDDARALRGIHNHYVEHTSVMFQLVPRTLEEQVEWVRVHAGGYPAVVGEIDGEVVGFGSLSPFRHRPAYAATVEDSVYVHPDQVRRGAGSAILGELLGRARSHGFHTVIARIVGDNDASIALHPAHGFAVVGVEREVGRKLGRWLDVVEMQKMCSDQP